jgi:transposase-like protein
LIKKKPKAKKKLAVLAYQGPKVLILDIETTPLEVYCWGLGEQHISYDNIIKDWSVLSWSAKWEHEDKVHYMDTRHNRNIRDDKKIVQEIYKLMEEADIIVGHNAKGFDIGKLNARFKKYRLKRLSHFRVIDTLQIARKHFKFTSNKLAYLTAQFCSVFIKSSHAEFPGMSLWTACLAKNMKAFKVMQDYNEKDVLSLQEMWTDLKEDGWDDTINYSVFNDDISEQCPYCASSNIQKVSGYRYKNNGKFQRYKCGKCGNGFQGKQNMLGKEKRQALKAF